MQLTLGQSQFRNTQLALFVCLSLCLFVYCPPPSLGVRVINNRIMNNLNIDWKQAELEVVDWKSYKVLTVHHSLHTVHNKNTGKAALKWALKKEMEGLIPAAQNK